MRRHGTFEGHPELIDRFDQRDIGVLVSFPFEKVSIVRIHTREFKKKKIKRNK